MTYTASHIANYMLDRAREERLPITQLKLLKLVYIAYGWNAALSDEPLFDEPIYAWKHGPVIKSLYDEFKHFEKSPITDFSVEFDLLSEDTTIPRIPSDDDKANLACQKVWDIYKKYKPWTLRNKTHEADTPWTNHFIEGRRDIVIPPKDIEEHFIAKLDTYLATE